MSKRMQIPRTKCTVTKYREFQATENMNTTSTKNSDAEFILDGLKDALGLKTPTVEKETSGSISKKETVEEEHYDDDDE